MKFYEKYLMWFYAVFIALLFSKCRNDDETVEFKDSEIGIVAKCKIGDVFYYKGDSGKVDSIKVLGFIKEKTKGGIGFMAPRPSNLFTVVVKDFSSYIDCESSNALDSFRNSLVIITKCSSGIDYSYQFRNFWAIKDSSRGESILDSLTFSTLKVNSYFKIQNDNEDTLQSDVNVLYWSDSYGMIGYELNSGEFWKLDSVNAQR